MRTSSIEAHEISIVTNAIKTEVTKAPKVSKIELQRNSKSCLPSIANEKSSDIANSNKTLLEKNLNLTTESAFVKNMLNSTDIVDQDNAIKK